MARSLDEAFQSLDQAGALGEPEAAPSPVAPSQAQEPAPDLQQADAKLEEQQKQKLQGALYVGTQTDPDRHAKVLELAGQLKMPSEVVERNYDSLKVKQAREGTDLDAVVKNNPGLASWIEQPDNMAVAHDDIPALSKIEEHFQDHTTLGKLYNSLGSGLSQLYSSAARVPGLIYDVAALPQNLAARAAGHPEMMVSAPDWLSKNPVANYYDEAAKSFHSKVPELDTNIVSEIGKRNWSRAGMGLATQFVANAPNQAALLAGAIGGYGVPALVGAGLTSAADASRNAKEAGAAPDIGTIDAVTKGTFEAGFESLGTLGLLKSWEHAISKSFGKQTAREVFLDFSKTIAHSVLGEANEEALTSVAQDLTDYITGVNPKALDGIANRAANAGLLGGVSGGLMTGPSAILSGSVKGRFHMVQEAKAAADFYKSLGESTQETRLNERSPELRTQYIASLAEGSPVQDVHISTEAFDSYFQGVGENPVAVIQAADLSKAYEQAKETGTDLKVPLATWVNQFVNTNHYQGLQNDIKFDPQQFSVNEAIREQERLKADVQAHADQAQAEAPAADPTAEEQSAQVGKNIRDQLVTQGFSQTDAAVQALLYEHRAKTRAQIRGQAPAEFVGERPLTITRTDEAGATSEEQVFNQAVPGVNPLGFYSQLEREVANIDFKQMPAKDLSGRIKNIQGLKKEELEYTGFSDWLDLKAQAGEKVTKEEAQKFLSDRGVQVQQVVLSEDFKGNDGEAATNAGDLDWNEGELQDPDSDYLSENAWNDVEETLKVRPREGASYSERKWLYDLSGAEYEFGKQQALDTNYGGMADSFVEKREELVDELTPDYTDSDGAVDQAGLDAAISKQMNRYVERDLFDGAYESARDSYYEGGDGEYEYTERETGWTLRGHSGYGDWYSPDTGNNYSGNIEEAKLQLFADMVAAGVVHGNVADLIKPKDIEWREPTEAERTEPSVRKGMATKLLKKEHARLIERSRAEIPDWFKSEGATPAEAEEEIERYARELALEEVDARLVNPDDKKNKVIVSISNNLLSGRLVGNNVVGYTFELDAPGQSRRARAGRDASKQFDIDATSIEAAKAEAIQILIDEKRISPEAPKPAELEGPVDVNAPSGSAKFENYTVPGGTNYREILITLPETGKDDFQYRNHFEQKNILAHVRLTDRVDAEGRKTLFVEEMQSDWHQQGRERGYKNPAESVKAKRESDEAEAVYREAVDAQQAASGGLNDYLESAYPEQDLQDVSSVLWRHEGNPTIVAQSDAAARIGKDAYERLIADPKAMELLAAAREKSAEYDKASARVNETRGALNKLGESVPDAPYKNTEAWSALAFKRVIRLAAEQGYEAVAWTPGSVHVERWGTDSISWVKKAEGQKHHVNHDSQNFWYTAIPDDQGHAKRNREATFSYGTSAELEGNPRTQEEAQALAQAAAERLSQPHWLVGSVEQVGGRAGGVDIETQARQRGHLLERNGERVTTKEELQNIIRSSLHRERNDRSLESLTDSVWKQMQSEDSGVKAPRKEGMEFFYDNVLPKKAAPAALKALDKSAKVTVGKIVTDADVMNGEEGGSMAVWEIPLTEAMKAKAMEGQALFQDGARGQIRFGKNSINIDLFKDANESTFLHETGHLWLGEVADDVEHVRAIEEGKRTEEQTKFLADADAILEHLGVKSFAEIGREQHETWARSVEAYLMEGKAPNSALRSAFNRFKVWLTEIYKQIVGLNVQLSPEIRRVMDRLLVATDEVDIAEAHMEMLPLFADPKFMGMSESKTKAYLKAQMAATDFAKETLERKVMTDYGRERAKWYREKRSQVRDEIALIVNQQMVFKAIAALQSNTLPDGRALPEGTPVLKLDKAQLRKQFGPDIVAKLPKGVSSKEGLHPDFVAQALGFENGDQLVQAMANAPKRDTLIDQKTDERMAEQYPDIIRDGRTEEEALAAVHNENRARVYQLELEHMASENMPALKEVIRRVARPVPNIAAVREQAEQIVGTLPMDEIKPALYARAEVKAGRQAADLLAKGEINAAFEAKRKQLLNHELYRSVVAAQARIEKAETLFDRLDGNDSDLAKSRDIDLINAARAVKGLFGYGETGQNPLEHLKQMQEYDPDGYATVSHLVSGAIENRPKPGEKMTYGTFSDFADTVAALWDLSKSQRQMEIDGKKQDIASVQAALQSRLSTLTGGKVYEPGKEGSVSKIEEMKVGALGLGAALVRMEAFVDYMDGDDESKPFRKYLWQPVVEAIDRYRVKKNEVAAQYKGLVEKAAKDGVFTQNPITSQELGYTFKDKAHLLGALLHTGNESNLEKLLVGRGWAVRDQDGDLDTSRWDQFMRRMYREGVIKKADMDFVQSLWNLMEQLKPDAQKAHKGMYGHYFNEITAKEIQTPFGTYKGGYAPAVADPFMSPDAALRSDRAALEDQANSFMFPTGGRGFTKSRVAQYSAPLSLDLNLVMGNIDKVLRFTHIEPRVKDAGRMVLNKEMRSALDSANPAITSDLLVPWLQRSVKQRKNASSQGKGGKFGDMMARHLRTNTGLQLMSANFINSIQNFTGATLAAVKVEPKYLRNAFWDYVRRPKAATAYALEKSEMMQTRMDNQTNEMLKDANEIMVNPSKYDKVKDFMIEHGRIFQTVTQGVLDVSVWNGAYEQAVAKGLSEKEAIREADSAVRTTQGSFNVEDVAKWETGSPVLNLFTQFMGYFNMVANLLGTEFGKTTRDMGLRKGAGRLLYVYTMGFMAPAFVGALIAQSLSGAKWDQDDDGQYMDDLIKTFFGSQFQFGTAMIPILGPLANSAFNRFNDKQYDDKVSLSPAMAMLEATAGVPFDIYKAAQGEGNAKRTTRDVLTALGLMTGLPLAPFAKPAGYLMDLDSGKAQPSGPVDLTRGLLTGKPGEKS